MQDATHFKRSPSPDNPQDYVFIPCSPGDPQAEERDLRDLPATKMRLLDVSIDDFL
eukprot:TRINITY_DN3039_c0_g1_i1.p1 TRINITY_DN3039_c0_g1~~TRINITY_DN3039_c0_g1_i1.p1  ORF type:complete len:56 (+),score=14.01 TRINITY_DN3039_c0_g1_i1:254-421(+)